MYCDGEKHRIQSESKICKLSSKHFCGKNVDKILEEGQLWKDQTIKDQPGSKFNDQRSKIKKKLTSDHKVNFPKDQRSNQVFELSSKNGAVLHARNPRENLYSEL